MVNPGDRVLADKDLTRDDLHRVVDAERLAVYGCTFPEGFDDSLERVWWFDFRSSRQRDLSFLPSTMPNLRYLALNTHRALEDLSAIARLEQLEFLWVYGLPKVVEGPSLASLTQLRRAEIATMKRVDGLAWVLDAPGLVELFVENVRSSTHDIDQIARHSTLSNLQWIGFAPHGPNVWSSQFADRIAHLDRAEACFAHDWFGVDKFRPEWGALTSD